MLFKKVALTMFGSPTKKCPRENRSEGVHTRFQNFDLYQGGADAVSHFYNDYPSPVLILNCARRFGSSCKLVQGNAVIYMLPMNEVTSVKQSVAYCDQYMNEWIQELERTHLVVINCQEGLHRSKNLMQVFCERFPTT